MVYTLQVRGKCVHTTQRNAMQRNRLEWNGMDGGNGMEWRNGMEWNRMEWNGGMAWNGI